jgi:hypothetical protein
VRYRNVLQKMFHPDAANPAAAVRQEWREQRELGSAGDDSAEKVLVVSLNVLVVCQPFVNGGRIFRRC